jgi:outer membrane PBP1 activator LpoA protein
MRNILIVLLAIFLTSCSVSTPMAKSNSSTWEITSNPNPEVRFYNQPEHGVFTMTWYDHQNDVLNIRYFKY